MLMDSRVKTQTIVQMDLTISNDCDEGWQSDVNSPAVWSQPVISRWSKMSASRSTHHGSAVSLQVAVTPTADGQVCIR